MKTCLAAIFCLFLGGSVFAAPRAMPADSVAIPMERLARSNEPGTGLADLAAQLLMLRTNITEFERMHNSLSDTTADSDQVKRLKALRASINGMINDIDKKIAQIDSVRAANGESEDVEGFSLFRGIQANFNERRLSWLQDFRNFLNNEQDRLNNITKGISKASDKLTRARISIAAKLKGLF